MLLTCLGIWRLPGSEFFAPPGYGRPARILGTFILDFANRPGSHEPVCQMKSSCAPAVFSMKSEALMIPSTSS
jgi:hypothetical protein